MEGEFDYSARLSEFARRVLPAKSVLIATHDYPDPDCLAAAAGLSQLLAFLGESSCKTAYGGFVGRAENRAMVEALDLTVIPMALVDFTLFDRVMVVDSVPGGGNVSLPPAVKVDAVFDHHLAGPQENAPYYQDIRKDVGATSTIVTGYIREAGCPLPPKVATALFYGIKTDTGGLGRESFAEDLWAYKFLFEHLDHRLLYQIERPDRAPEFFRVLNRAATSMSLCQGTGFLYLAEVSTPDYVGEMADFFHSLEGEEWTVCAGLFQDSLFYSLRCKKNEQAGALARDIGKLLGGSGGGHAKIGAGRIPLSAFTDADLAGEFKKTVKKVLDISAKPETPLLKL
ncbi:MAG: DHH family phosphoesterase [Thermodesulfobacteriota bacterium]